MSNQSYQQLGDYRLGQLLGEGTCGDVYLSEHPIEKRPVAVKVLKVHLTPKTIKIFFTEARMIHLKHPHILQLLDFDIDKDIPFLVMDYAPYGTLRQRHPSGSRVPLPIVCSYVNQIADALQYAHEKRLIHRDVKPSNMLVGAEQQILVSDFGIAVVAHSDQSLVTQDLAGTALYMAPEQIKGKSRPASDQYALGIMVYEWLCGAYPFEGATWEVIEQHMHAAPPPLSEKIPTISAEVAAVVAKALAKDPHDRFADMRTFAHALTQAADQRAAHVAEQLEKQAAPIFEASKFALPPSNKAPGVPMPSLHTPPPSTSTISSDNVQIEHMITSPLPPLTSPPPPSNAVAPFSGPKQGKHPSSFQAPGVSRSLEDQIEKGQSRELPNTAPDPAYLRPGEQDISFFNRRPSRRMPRGGKVALVAAGGGLTWRVETRPLPVGTLLYTYQGHSDVVVGVAWSPDGKRIASASMDGTVQVWIAIDGSQPYVYRGHSGPVIGVAWSPDGKRIASASMDGTVQVWNAIDGSQPYVYRGHSRPVIRVAWSPDGKRIASGDDNPTVQVWIAANGRQIYTYQGHPYELKAVAWSPDNTRIASGGNDNTVQIWAS